MSPVRRQSVRTTFGLDATVGGYVGAMSDSSARALRHLAKKLLQSATHTTERPRGAATESRVDGTGTDGRGEGLHPGGEWGEATKICWENFQARWGMPSSSNVLKDDPFTIQSMTDATDQLWVSTNKSIRLPQTPDAPKALPNYSNARSSGFAP
eukprot:jgi/Chrzof1/12441/Cz06g34230.t1